MTTREALDQIMPALAQWPAIFATGYISREAQAAKHRPENFYVIGSMGLCSSIGLGLALSLPHEKVFVLDGDGSVLMNLGNLAMAGSLAPKNFIHIVLDNEAYASTGNQKTLSAHVHLEEIARASGYKTVHRMTAKENLTDTLKKMIGSEGPSFLLIKVGPDAEKPAPRIQQKPDEITQQFMRSVKR